MSGGGAESLGVFPSGGLVARAFDRAEVGVTVVERGECLARSSAVAAMSARATMEILNDRWLSFQSASVRTATPAASRGSVAVLSAWSAWHLRAADSTCQGFSPPRLTSCSASSTFG